MKFRKVFLGLGSFLVLIVLLLSDPDGGLVQNLPFGSSTVSLMIVLVISILYIGLLHVARKGLFDYIDMKKYFDKALLTPEGAGMALISLSLAMIAIAIVILAATS